MDRQKGKQAVQCSPQKESSSKKRVLIINAHSVVDFIRAGQLVKRFREDVEKYNQKPGRNHGIIYTVADRDRPADPAYVWYTKTQITIVFEE
jgi:hypothetical protein